MCKSYECGHLQTPYGRPFHSELGAHGWSRYGAPWSEQVASGKSAGSRNRKNKRIPLPLAATGCVGKYMVSRASAVGCHPSREVPSLRGRGVDPSMACRSRALLLVAVRTRTLLASTAGARVTDHAAIVSAKQSAAESLVYVEAP